METESEALKGSGKRMVQLDLPGRDDGWLLGSIWGHWRLVGLPRLPSRGLS